MQINRRNAINMLSVGAPILAIEFDKAFAADNSATRFPRNAQEYDQLFQQTKNWGRWGKDDQLGTLNLISVEKSKAATALVRRGVSVSFSHPVLTEVAADDHTPFEHTMNKGLRTDTYKTSYHGMTTSHIDALCHRDYNGLHYNGFTFAMTNTQQGCKSLNVELFKNGIVTRGVLIDIPRLKNVPYLERGDAIFVEDIEAWEKKAGVRVSTGDVFYLRTGRWRLRDKLGPWNFAPGGDNGVAGLHVSVVPWLKERGVAIVGSDAVTDVLPSRVEGVFDPVHVALIAGLGLPLLDNQDPEAVANAAARFETWEFMTTIAPLVVPGGTGSPINALAIF